MTPTSEFATSEKREIAVLEALEAAMYAMFLVQNATVIVFETKATLDFSEEIRKLAHAIQLFKTTHLSTKR